jgi:tRNA A-37 threonylcarbamoyl transferase component Bud32
MAYDGVARRRNALQVITVAEIPAQIPRNRFHIVGQLGRGALAEVYLCKLRGVAGFEKEVVVKRISAEYAADPLFVRMFLDEARVAARLTHPNIVQVFEVGEEDSVPYIAMEYVRGVTLEMVIRRAHQEGKIHYGHFAQIIAKICDALAYAHNAVDPDGEPVGLVHREVSPANIVLNLDGIPKLLDFGMAAAKDRLLHTQDGMLTGELRYMAPEQVSRGRLDHRADVFSLGITLFELTTGVNPFGPPGQRDSEVLQKVLNVPIRRPSQLVPGYPQTLEKIVLSAVERNVDRRCPSAREFRDRLEVFAVRKEHLSIPRSLAAWIRELFPDFTALTKASEVTTPRIFPTAGGVPVTVASLRQTGTHEIIAPPVLLTLPKDNFFPWKWVAIAASGLAVAAAVWAVTRTGVVDSTRTSSPTLNAASPFATSVPRDPLSAPPEPDPEGETQRVNSELPAVEEAAKKAIARTETPDPSAPEASGARPDDPPLAVDDSAAAPQSKNAGPGRSRARLRQAPPRRTRRASAAELQTGRRRIESPSPRTRSPPVEASLGEAPSVRLSAPSLPPTEPPSPSEKPPVVAATEAAGPPVEATRPALESSAEARGLNPAAQRPEPPAPQRQGGPTFSATPKSRIPIPALPREHIPRDVGQLVRLCQAVEESVIFAGVSAPFARGITLPLRRRVAPNTPVHPIAMYYFIVTEAALKHDSVTAANNLAAAHASGHLVKLKNLPGFEKGL